jgi:menaquinone-dependent protoporphyrinogen oxidase
MGRWLPAAVTFVEQNSAALGRVPVAYFAVHLMALDDSEASRKQRASYLEAATKIITPQHEAFFAGKIDSRQLGLVERLKLKAVRSPEGDQRDWQSIRAWADGIFRN